MRRAGRVSPSRRRGQAVICRCAPNPTTGARAPGPCRSWRTQGPAPAPTHHIRRDDPQPQPDENTTAELVRVAGGRMPDEPGGSVRAAVANAMVGMKKEFYGRGPTAAKAWILDDYVFVVLDGGL